MIVIDASSLVGAALKPGSSPEKAANWVAANSGFALSVPVMREVTSVLGRPKFARLIPQSRGEVIVQLLRTNGTWLYPSIRVADCRDAKDNKYLELALVANAECIVSSDNDLRVLNPWRGIPILSPAEFLASR